MNFVVWTEKLIFLYSADIKLVRIMFKKNSYNKEVFVSRWVRYKQNLLNYYFIYRSVKMKFTITCVLLMTVVYLSCMGDVDAIRCCSKCRRNGQGCQVFLGRWCRCTDGSVIAAREDTSNVDVVWRRLTVRRVSPRRPIVGIRNNDVLSILVYYQCACL